MRLGQTSDVMGSSFTSFSFLGPGDKGQQDLLRLVQEIKGQESIGFFSIGVQLPI